MLGFKRKDTPNLIKLELKKPILPSVVLLTVFIVGSIGYYWQWKDIPGSNIVDAMYMTVITITTIGFGEIHPLGTFGRIFTTLIAVAGVGSLFYVLSVFMENLVIIQLNNYRGKKKMQKKIGHLKNHIILVGHGRVGHLAAREMMKLGIDFVAVDDSIKDPIYIPVDPDMLYIEGDATEDEILLHAGIDSARGMIVTTADPSTTVFVVLSAKVLNPKLYIVARADNDQDIEKLKRAGADKVINPYSIGGQRMAQLMINRNVIDFFQTSFGNNENNLKIEHLILPENSTLLGQTLKELNIRHKVGASILAVIRDNTPILNPGAEFALQKGDQLLVIGTDEQLANISKMIFRNK